MTHEEHITEALERLKRIDEAKAVVEGDVRMRIAAKAGCAPSDVRIAWDGFQCLGRYTVDHIAAGWLEPKNPTEDAHG